jgi:hypothetical protein
MINLNTNFLDLLEDFPVAQGDDREMRFEKPNQVVRVMMSPKDFFRHVSNQIDREKKQTKKPKSERYKFTPAKPEFWKKSYGKVFSRIKTGKPVDAPCLQVDVGNGRVVGHEGRHRAYASLRLGVKKIPVDIWHHRKANDRWGGYIGVDASEHPHIAKRFGEVI